MTDRSEIAFPKLTPETARVFIAEDDDYKVEKAVESLGQVGLAENVAVARTWDEAEAYVGAQIPGELAANIFLLDGELDETRPGGRQQGSALVARMFRKYREPLSVIVDQAIEFFTSKGLTEEQARELVRTDSLDKLAANSLTSEVLFVGISRTDEGALRYPAQIPHADYQKVGGKILGALPQEIRNNLLKTKR